MIARRARNRVAQKYRVGPTEVRHVDNDELKMSLTTTYTKLIMPPSLAFHATGSSVDWAARFLVVKGRFVWLTSDTSYEVSNLRMRFSEIHTSTTANTNNFYHNTRKRVLEHSIDSELNYLDIAIVLNENRVVVVALQQNWQVRDEFHS